MDLLSLPLSPSTSLPTSLLGNYLPPLNPSAASPLETHLHKTFKEECLLFARSGGTLELWGIRNADGELSKIAETRLFSQVRSMANFRHPGSSQDHVMVGTTSGSVTVFGIKAETGQVVFEKVHCESFGKSGVRRGTPGQYVAVDPAGRALMIAAVEKQVSFFFEL